MSESTSARPVLRRRVALAIAALSAALALPALVPSRAEAVFCTGSQDRGTAGENSVQYLFVCEETFTVRSYKVDPSKPVGSFTPASSERGGRPQPPPEGFLCFPHPPDPSDWFSCEGQASAGSTVRGGFGTREPPCPLTTLVTVGDGPLNPVTGEPTGTTFTFELQGNLCTRSTPGLRETASCIPEGEQGLCRELVNCKTSGALLLDQSDAVAKLRRCVQLDTRYRLHSHADGYHTHRRRKRLRASRSPFWRLYRTAQGRTS